jgi:hypothetical protein
MTLSGIENMTYRLVGQCLNNWTTVCPNAEKGTGQITDCPLKI